MKRGLVKYTQPGIEPNNWRSNNKGLYVLIHGLKGIPCIFDSHFEDIRRLHPEAEVR